MTQHFGKYRGKVENNLDPMMMGRLQVSVPAAMLQPGTGGLMLQMMPAPAGSTSVTWTLVAGAVPVLVTVIVKPIWSPAFTVVASAALAICKAGAQVTLIVACACTTGWLVACAEAILG